MSPLQQQRARIIRAHYRLKRPVTAQEVSAEIANLERKAKAGIMCDLAERLYCALDLGARLAS